MTAKTTKGDAQDAVGDAARTDRPVEERAEEIVAEVSEQVARFARRLVARTREELEDIVAEAQSIRRGARPRE